MSNQLNWFDSRVKWVLGDDKHVRLWEDIWVCDQSLKEKFPRLYSSSMYKDNVTGDVGELEFIKSRKIFKWDLI